MHRLGPETADQASYRQVGNAVAIQVGHPRSRNLRAPGNRPGRLKGSVAIAEQHYWSRHLRILHKGNRSYAEDNQIGLVIAVQVRGYNVDWRQWCKRGVRVSEAERRESREASPAIVHQNCERIRSAIRDDQVGPAIAIQIRRRD